MTPEHPGDQDHQRRVDQRADRLHGSAYPGSLDRSATCMKSDCRRRSKREAVRPQRRILCHDHAPNRRSRRPPCAAPRASAAPRCTARAANFGSTIACDRHPPARPGSARPGRRSRFSSTVPRIGSDDLRRMLAMRLLAAARLGASGSCRKPDQRAQPRIEIERRGGPCGEHGVEHLGRDREACVALEVVGAQALEDVVVYLACGVLGRRERECRERLRDQLLQVEVEPALDGDAQQAERRAAQAERIARAGRLLAGREDAGDGVELVRDRDAPCRCAWPAARRPRSAAGTARAAPRRLRPARRRAARSSDPSGPAAPGTRRPSR